MRPSYTFYPLFSLPLLTTSAVRSGAAGLRTAGQLLIKREKEWANLRTPTNQPNLRRGDKKGGCIGSVRAGLGLHEASKNTVLVFFAEDDVDAHLTATRQNITIIIIIIISISLLL